MDFQNVSDILSNFGISVLIILAIGIALWRCVPKIYQSITEYFSAKDERYNQLVERVIEEGKIREDKMNITIEKTTKVNEDLSTTNKILTETNKKLVETIDFKFEDVNNKITNVEKTITKKLDDMATTPKKTTARKKPTVQK